jgi:hypothetical protein
LGIPALVLLLFTDASGTAVFWTDIGKTGIATASVAFSLENIKI